MAGRRAGEDLGFELPGVVAPGMERVSSCPFPQGPGRIQRKKRKLVGGGGEVSKEEEVWADMVSGS